MQDQDGIQAVERSVYDEHAVAADSNHPQRNHRLHVESQEDEHGREVTGYFPKVAGYFANTHEASPSISLCLLLV
jgi:hypothetical protein